MKVRIRSQAVLMAKAKRAEPDPSDVAFEKGQAERAANVARLEAKVADSYRKIDELTERAIGKAGTWLCYMPPAAGSPELIGRAFRYLEAMRTRIEAEGGRMWLCKDHDCSTHIFEISEFRAAFGCVFCRGEFTAIGQKYRHLFKGVSHDNMTFAGDIDLVTSIVTSKDCMHMDDMPAHVKAAARSDAVRGLAGAVCLSFEPNYGPTRIYSIAHDKMNQPK